ncbi:hypothetical protein Nepgr_003514 [Nepenthes gracilis]|uniref:J domain-containing protein n=1 Tax=Nepenthes gracilis TaxID=150966 RepID=A0AAD3RZP4_NEPGR|nr:hypothetical protein Nepgr_003514 [Nepenthes gracilis]
MGVDYYNVLKVSRTASDEELRKAYKKLAMRWHPDKHPSSSKQVAESKFKQICEAYDVLSDPQKRQIYDLYGEEALKSGQFTDVSSPSSAMRGGGWKGSSFRYNPRDAEDIFAEFFTDGVSEKGNAANGGSDQTARKASAVETQLVCTLEELYKGSKRKMKISRIVSDDSGKPMTVEEVLGIDVKPGWKKGTKITFPEKGNQEPGIMPGDLIFVIDEKPHSVFKRDGNDLMINQKISLLDALTGKTLNLTTLDGRNLTIDVSDIVKPGHEVVIPNEGMPISKDPKKKGNLRIRFDVKFPSRLSTEQKSELRRVLGGSS